MKDVILTERQKQEHLFKMLNDFDTAMLVTHTDHGSLRSRPLSIAKPVEQGGKLYFATARASGKVHEIESDDEVNVSLQDKRHFVSLAGTARIVEDRALVDKLWSEAWKIWFPQGKDDPSLCLVEVTPSAAEYWDEGSTNGLKYAFEMASAYVKGTRPTSHDDKQNARVKL